MAKLTSPKAEVKRFKFPCRIYATYHPRAVLQGGFEFEDKIVADLERFNRRELQAARDRSPQIGTRRIGYDTEYDPSGKLLTVGIGTADEAAAYEVSDSRGIVQAKKVIKGAKTLVGHSITGDLDQLVALGIAKESWLRGID